MTPPGRATPWATRAPRSSAANTPACSACHPRATPSVYAAIRRPSPTPEAHSLLLRRGGGPCAAWWRGTAGSAELGSPPSTALRSVLLPLRRRRIRRRGLRLDAGLHPIEPGIGAPGGDQGVVAAFLGDPPFGQHQDPVGVAHGR